MSHFRQLIAQFKQVNPKHRAHLEYVSYAVFASAWVLYFAVLFFSAMKLQLGFSEAHATGQLPALPPSEWSAPLDDVFIHFDFARSTARGFPFQWSEGNGYSSGGTSLLYPFTLALGYWVGFRGLSLMLWAALLACICCLGFLLAARRLFSGLPWWSAWLAPPALFCVGALNWSLFSGMEVALFLGLWALCLVVWDDIIRADELYPSASPVKQAGLLGFTGALMVATRPEAAALIALFGISAAWVILKRTGAKAAIISLILAGTPALLVLVSHGVANKWLTGSSTAAGALVKLEMHHPHLTSEQVWDAWVFHVKYQVMRVTHYHLSEQPGWGWILWFLGVVALIPRKTRRYAIILWLSATSWVLIVALNGQVRWQNERYTMPALVWLLMLAALGAGSLMSLRPARGKRGVYFHAFNFALAACLCGAFVVNQLPRFREQVWFFARASRNIRDQHVTAGALIKQLNPQRVLVGDAGAITYQADLPGLDIIGLGGYRGLPFAQATQIGLPAAIELVQRMAEPERPDLLAIYPGWWGSLPLWFGNPLLHVPVRGNVICGGKDKVIYRPDWSSFEFSDYPFSVNPGEVLVDALDFADIVSEREHHYQITGTLGYVEMKKLPNPKQPARDLWDGGRIGPPGSVETFQLSGSPGQKNRLLFRAAPATAGEFEVFVGEEPVGKIQLEAGDAWQELSLPFSPQQSNLELRLVQTKGERILYHVWWLKEP